MVEHDSEDELPEGGSFIGKLRAKVVEKRNSLNQAQGKQEQLQKEIQERQSQTDSVATRAEETATVEREAITRLSTHKFSLDQLLKELLTKRSSRADTGVRKTAEAKRLTEDLAMAKETTQAARAKLEAARSKNMQMAAELKSKIDDAEQNVSNASIAQAVASEHHVALKKAVAALNERLESCTADLTRFEIERDGKQHARDAAQRDLQEAVDDLKGYQTAASQAALALASHTETSARRARAHEAEVRRAKEYAAQAVALRDTRSRGMILGDDRPAFEPAEHQALQVAEAASEQLKLAVQRQEESARADKEKLGTLKVTNEHAAADVRRRELVVSKLAERFAGTEAALQAATIKFNCAKAAVTATEEDRDSLKKKVEGPLQKSMDECSTKLKEAEKTLADLRARQDTDLAPFRHAEEAESVLLKQYESQEAVLVQLLDEARTLAAEAVEDQAEPKAGAAGYEQISFTLESCKARLADRKRDVAAAEEAARAAADALSNAEQDLREPERRLENLLEYRARLLQAEPPRDDSDDEDSDYEERERERERARAEQAAAPPSESEDQELSALRQRISGLKATVEELRQVAADKQAASEAAAKALRGVEAEIKDLESQKTSAPLPSIMRMLEAELDKVAEYTNLHESRAQAALDTSRKVAEEWAAEKAALRQELQRAAVQVEVANNDLKSFPKVPR
eukprot:SRR837773.2484.p1 GENE.SRR837773.2484~~SRR837773.2484.p1  ORF type:complete len:810 (-),score=378.26 SRR837773.2484:46-2115(-)